MQISNAHNNSMYGTSFLQGSLLENASKNKKSVEEEKIAQTAEDFEAFFITKSLESMFEGVSTDGMFGGGQAEKIYRSILFNEYGKVMAQTGGIGVKDEVMRSILEMQEMASKGYIEK